ncbi:hypothetical protein F53441_12308 [Fusarium austroafricanum]|uniref:Uncharacterized protein n=1 Tax=Fusarium austroafricanum TaxID=2364996 RepID=A0A8H4JY34_9HYPO|nr:hypothetical protein F53441_12308 [Fusarium austroafricanum]
MSDQHFENPESDPVQDDIHQDSEYDEPAQRPRRKRQANTPPPTAPSSKKRATTASKRPGRPRKIVRTPPPSEKRRPGRPRGAKNKKPSKADMKTMPPEERAKAKKEAGKELKEKKHKSDVRHQMNEGAPSLRERDLKRMCLTQDEPRFDEQWTRLDEQALPYYGSAAEDEIEELERKCTGNTTKNSFHGDLAFLWRVSIRLYHSTPFTLLSPRYGLDYILVSPSNNEPGNVWGQNFAKSLSQVITHPFFRADIDLLRTVLQYAVICRTDDRRPWKIPMSVRGGPLTRMKADIESEEGSLSCSVHSIHKRARRATATSDYSIVSDVTFRLGEVAKENTESRQASRFAPKPKLMHDEFVVRAVSIVDLHNIEQAINTLGLFGVPELTSMDTARKNFVLAQDTHADQPSKAQLADFVRRGLLYEQREIVRLRGENGRQENADEDSDHRIPQARRRNLSSGLSSSRSRRRGARHTLGDDDDEEDFLDEDVEEAPNRGRRQNPLLSALSTATRSRRERRRTLWDDDEDEEVRENPGSEIPQDEGDEGYMLADSDGPAISNQKISNLALRLLKP